MTRSRRTEVRKTPSSLSTMTVSDFVRGGLYDIDKATVVVTHGEPMGMWIPRGQYETLVGVAGTYYASNSTSTMTVGTPGTVMASSLPLLRGTVPSGAVDVDSIRAAVDQLHKYLNPEKEKNG